MVDNEDIIGDDSRCLCGLQSFKVLLGKTSSSLDNIDNCPCYMKRMIEFLHEQILGCKENDESARPKVSLCNEFFKNEKLLDIRKPIDLTNKCTDLRAYSVKTLEGFKPVNTVPFMLTKTKEELDAMMDDLLKCREIAVNLEYYSIRSYFGFTWLLQISTTKTNYYIDCIKLETHLPILNEVFMSINILKIFYKGEDSILRLQKDFGIFVTNMIDIYSIECSLHRSQQKELIENSVFFFLDPKHTYQLLFINSYLLHLLFELKMNKLLNRAITRCSKICSQVYNKPEWNDVSVFKKLGSNKATCQEIHIIEQILIWRNQTAKIEDVALSFILPDDKILKCAQELLKFGHSETFVKYCNPEFLVNRKVDLKVDMIIERAKKNSTKKLCIENCLSKRITSSLFTCTPQITKRETNPPSVEKSNCPETININEKKITSIDAISSSNDKVHEQKLNKKNKGLPRKNIEKSKNQKHFKTLKMLKPQLRFKDEIDNSSRMWVPRIAEKPNQLVPLNLFLLKHGTKSHYCHPYKTELEHFCVPRSQLITNTPIPICEIEDTPLYFINTFENLVSLSSKLKNHTEIAVDLKYNKNRSYLGYTSLLLISTRNSDYIIDALSLRCQLPILNEVFTDPKILKVFHNSTNKLLWLQKDLSLYVVNMFDVARTQLVFNNKKIHSLTYLKYHICDIKYMKELHIQIPWELNDWRMRPLPFKVKHYLRYETHCLLYIKDILSNQLCGSGNMLKRYYDYCTDLCKNVYHKPTFKINCYKNIFYKNHVKDKYAGQVIRIKVMKDLNRLRHMIAQREDEAPNDILPEEDLLKIVDSLTLDQGKICNIWNYDKKKKYASQITRIISSAKNTKMSSEKDNDYQYSYELENCLDEVIKCQVSYEKESNCNERRRILTLGDFIFSNKIDDISDYPSEFNKNRKRQRSDEIKTSIILVKGHRWDEKKNIGDWLNKWTDEHWPGCYYVKELNNTMFLINLFEKKYRDIIWKKRHQIHFEEGAFIHNPLSHKDSRIQKSLSNIAKDLREKGRKVKIRELAIKVEDKWYELKSIADGLQEVSEKELRKRGIDTDL